MKAMRILIVSATPLEIKPLLSAMLPRKEHTAHLKYFKVGDHDTDVLITGVGMAATAFWMGKIVSSNRYDVALNLGIAGSFDNWYFDKNDPGKSLGRVVNVCSDRFAEMGVEETDGFTPLWKLGLVSETDMTMVNGNLRIPGKNEALYSEPINNLPDEIGITVNKITTDREQIKRIVERIAPGVESMEGAAFMYACAKEGIPCAQVRAISNYVGERDKNKWELELAIENLNEEAIRILNGF